MNSKSTMSQGTRGKILAIPKYSAFLCLMVVLIHNSIPAYFKYEGYCVDYYLHYVLTHVLPKVYAVAVPSFFVISGYLFYLNYDLSKTTEKLKKRFHTLVIPYVLWNIVGTSISLFTRIPFFSSMGTITPEPLNLKNIIVGCLFHKYTVLWFVFALILFVLFSPLIYAVMKNKRIGLCVIILSIILMTFFFQESSLPFGLYFQNSSIVYYSIGSYLGIHHKTFFYTMPDKQSYQWLILFLFLILVELIVDNSEITISLIVLKSYCLWRFFRGIESNIRWRDWFGMTFFIYAFHHPIMRFVSGMLRYINQKYIGMYLFSELILYVCTFLIAVSVCIYAAKTLYKKCPFVYKTLTGNRA